MTPLRIALLGRGKMGRTVADLAARQGHAVAGSYGAGAAPSGADALRRADVAIDFSAGEAVEEHVTLCLDAGVPIVVGTTGWQDRFEQVRARVEEEGGALVHGANFSVGVNLFYRVVREAALLLPAAGYAPFLEEAHHAAKRDAPSGTALHLQGLVAEASGIEAAVAVTRAGFIPGTHRVGFDAAPDQIVLTHTARSREGFAAGALLAASWIVGRKGVHAFADVLEAVLKDRKRRA